MTETMQGKVVKLFITQNDECKTRVSPNTITVDEFGIKNDKFYNKNSMRSVLITSQESYILAEKNGIKIEEGSLGENILIDIDPYSLEAGDTLTIGTTVLEITQHCTLCKGLSTLNSKLPKLLKNDRGIFARVVTGNSEISIGNNVEIPSY